MSPASEFRPPARFRILRRVGAGGMGVVYEAIDENSGGRVALKTLKAVAPGTVLAFKEEFRALTGFSHPNVATLYELLSAGDQWFISMEFIDGLSFLDYLCMTEPDETADVAAGWQPNDDATLTLLIPDANAGPGTVEFRRGLRVALEPLKVRETMRQLARAVMALHAESILHRDLKPSNVRITPEGRLFVLDFGLAERLNQFGESSQPSHVSGTAAYMAPEQAAGEALSPAADWYAMGVMLYEALSGKCPFEGNVQTLLRNKQKLDAPPLEAHVVERDAELAELCMDLLRREPARRPNGAEVIVRLGGSSVSVAFSPKRIAFVGRESQLATLRSAFAGARRGVTKVALIVGKSGMGKSALASHFLTELESRGDVLILQGRCYESESLPFKAFDSIVDSLARYLTERTTAEVNRVLPRGVSALSQVFPVLNQVAAIGTATERHPVREARELRQRAFGALRDLLIRLGDLRRLVVYIDDVQWGDSDSAALLRHVAQEPDAPEMLLIAACREEYAEHGELLSALLDHPDCVRVPVGPLTGEESRRLATELCGAGERAERIAKESGGSPYFVQELRETSEDSETTALSLDAVLYGRVAALTDGAKRLIEIAAVSGRPLPEDAARLAAGLAGEDQRIPAMLRAQRLIRGAAGYIETYHDRVREAVVSNLDKATLQRHHLSLATILEASAADSEAIAEHFAGAGESERAAPHYVKAAERACDALAFDQAAKLFSRAAELSGDGGDERRGLHIKLADALANAGRGGEAARNYREAAKGASPAEAAELERREAYWFAASGHLDEGRESLQRMLDRVGVRVPGPRILGPAFLLAEARILMHRLHPGEKPPDRASQKDIQRLDVCWDTVRGFGVIDPPAGFCVIARNLPLALRVGGPLATSRMLAYYSVGASSVQGALGRRRVPEMLAYCGELAAMSDSPYAHAFLSFAHGMVGFLQGNWRESQEHFRQAEQVFTQDCTGVAWELATMRLFPLWNLLHMGHYKELRRLAPALRQDGRERGDLYLSTSIGSGPHPAAELMAGHPDEAMALLDEALSRWTRQKYSLQFVTAANIRAWIHLYKGEGNRALEFLNREWPALKKHHYLRLSGSRQWLHFARAQAALSVRDYTTAERDGQRLAGDETRFAKILAKVVRAGCARLRGDAWDCIALLEEAAPEFDAVCMGMMAASVRYRLGELTGNRGLVEEAARAMRTEGVVDPERHTNIFANGFR
ncbi:MAG TPA: protein kinase [Bryobacteraceae bacterium]